MISAQLREAKRTLTKQIAALVRGAHRKHIFAVEALIQQYQADLLKTLDSASHALARSAKDSGHLSIVVSNLIFDFEKVGAKYLQEAADAGFARALSDLHQRGWLQRYQSPVYAPKNIVSEVLRANRDYLRKSLMPDLHRHFYGSSDVQRSIASIRSRVALYGHYLWPTAEKSYALAIKDFFAAHAKAIQRRASLHEAERPKTIKLVPSLREGGLGSGNFGHSGRPGEVGGSGPGKGNTSQRAVFLVGGGGSGKGSTRNKYIEKFDIPAEHVIDADKIKEKVPLYTEKEDENGMYGPSGPRTPEEYAKYPQSDRDAMDKYIADNTKYANVDDFVHNSKDPDVTPEKYGGGITHEVSSYIAKEQLRQSLEDGTSFINDAVGSDKYMGWAKEALAKGMSVSIHQVYAPRAVALMRNDERPRSVPVGRLLSTHDKADDVGPRLRAFVAEQRAQGQSITFHYTRAYNREDRKRARERGYTDTSSPVQS